MLAATFLLFPLRAAPVVEHWGRMESKKVGKKCFRSGKQTVLGFERRVEDRFGQRLKKLGLGRMGVGGSQGAGGYLPIN